MDVKQLANGIRIYAESDMERYRAETFFSKEPETIAWINDFKGGVFFDVGANIGVYSLYAAKTHPDMMVCSFEPVLSNYKRLLENIELNGLTNIQPFNCAVSNHGGLTMLYIPHSEVGTSGAQIDKPFDEHNVEFLPEVKQIVPQTRLDDLLAFVSPDYIKIDVDGREVSIIGGAPRCFRASKSVLIECNTDKLATAALDKYMKACKLSPDKYYNEMPGHSSERRGGNPVNIVYSNAAI